MKLTTPIVAMAAATAVTSTVLLATSGPEDVAIKPSPGVTAEQLLQVEQIGRTNVHSGGRTGGAANKRHGGRGHNLHHPASDIFIGDAAGEELQPAGYNGEGEIQMAGRTNPHSDGRAGGRALPRRGHPSKRGIGGIRKVDYLTPNQTGTVITLQLVNTEFLPEFGIGAGAGHGLKGKDRGNRMAKKPRRGVGGCSGGGCRKISYTPGDIIIQPADNTEVPEVGIGSAAGIGLDDIVTIQLASSTEEYPEMIGRGAGKKIKKSVRAGGRGPRQPNHNR